jgi:hypothetical protein
LEVFAKIPSLILVSADAALNAASTAEGLQVDDLARLRELVAASMLPASTPMPNPNSRSPQ